LSTLFVSVDSTLDVARSFVQAVQDRNADAAAALCADDVEVTLPGLPEPFQGKEGIRQMIRLAPSELVQTPREESVDGRNVRITTLTRAPGVFANYTTWNFEIDGALVRRLDFELRAAN
jgi:ketosteroid isomerase-like protein